MVGPEWNPMCIATAALVVQRAHALAHAERRGNGAVRRREGRHDGIADGLHHAAVEIDANALDDCQTALDRG